MVSNELSENKVTGGKEDVKNLWESYFCFNTLIASSILSTAVKDFDFFSIKSIPLPSPHPSSRTSPCINGNTST